VSNAILLAVSFSEISYPKINYIKKLTALFSKLKPVTAIY